MKTPSLPDSIRRNSLVRRSAAVSAGFVRTTFMILLLLVIVGCVATQRIIWSPDGQHAAVIADGGNLYLCDGEGKLSDVLLSNVTTAAWFSDSRQLAIARSESFTNWVSLAAVLPAEMRDHIQREAEQLLTRLQTGDLTPLRSLQIEFKKEGDSPVLKEQPKTATQQFFGAQLLYLIDKQNAAFRKALKNEIQGLQPLTVKVTELQVARVLNEKLDSSRSIACDFGTVYDLRVAPSDGTIAYTAEIEDMITRLLIVPSDGSQPPT